MTFTWRRTFPNTHHDFVAEEAGQHVGRIRRMHGGPQDGVWIWSCTGCQRGHEATGVRPLNGEARPGTKRLRRLPPRGPGKGLERKDQAAAGTERTVTGQQKGYLQALSALRS